MNIYEDLNLTIFSVRVIKILKQIDFITHYIAEFQRLHQYIPWNESMFTDQFYDRIQEYHQGQHHTDRSPGHSPETSKPHHPT